jgi:type IV secretory pathway VirB10-like protein
MAGRKKQVAAKSKRNKMRSKSGKKAVARAVSRKKKTPTKKRAKKAVARKRVPQRPQARQPSRRPAPVVEDTIVDIVDEPLPGVVRVTEIEEVRMPGEGSDEQDED